MSNDLIPVQPQGKKLMSSFWDKPEGTTGMGIAFLIGGGLLYGLYKIMPYLAQFLDDTLHVIIFSILIAVIAWVTCIDPTLRNLLWLRYKLLMRALTYSVIQYDPFGVLRETQAAAKERIKTIAECLGKVKGSVSDILGTLNELKGTASDIQKNVDYLTRNNGTKTQLDTQNIRYAQTMGAIEKLNKAYNLTSGWADKLGHAKEALETINDNIAFKISIDEKVYKAVNSSHTAWKLFSAAFKGDSGMDQLQNDTLNYLAQDYNEKIGEIDGYMDESQKFIDSFDLQQAIYADEGGQMLNQLNQLSKVDLSRVSTAKLLAPV